MPLISFVITYYNLPVDMLRLCVESIVNLSLMCNEREIIIIDDGSDQSPLEGLGELAREVVCIRQENGGLSDARNHGMRIAKGEYIQFVDADDCLIKQDYEKCLGVLKKSSADMVLFRLTNGTAEKAQREYPQTSGATYMANNNLRSTACGYLFKKSIAQDLEFTKGIYHEDDEFTPLLMLNAATLIPTDHHAYWYREREGSITSSHDKSRVEKRLDDKLGVIIRLKERCAQLEGIKRKALNRRVDQLTMDYIYTCLIDLKGTGNIIERIKELRFNGLYPLSNNDYTAKYKVFRIISSNRLGIWLLAALLPLIKKER